MFCSLGFIFCGTEGVESRFHVLRSRTRFRRYRRRLVQFSCFALRIRFRQYRRRRVPFSCIALPDSFSAGPRASGPVSIFCAPEPVFGSTDGFGSRFHVLRSRTHFRRYRRRRVPFSFSALPDSFLAVPTASRTVIMFCAPGLIFDGIEGVRSHFHVLRARTYFRRYRGRRV
jgi:hypothetical protein